MVGILASLAISLLSLLRAMVQQVIKVHSPVTRVWRLKVNRGGMRVSGVAGGVL